jgi:hypothetical protein
MRVRWEDRLADALGILSGSTATTRARTPLKLVRGHSHPSEETERIIAECSGLTREEIAPRLEWSRDLAEFEVVS